MRATLKVDNISKSEHVQALADFIFEYTWLSQDS